MFTDRFIEFPVEIVRPANESLGTKEEVLCIDSIFLNPMDIAAYRKHYNEDGQYDDCTTIELRSRDNVIVYLPIREVEKLLNEHQK